MSSRVIIGTLRFCTKSIDTLNMALNILHLSCSVSQKNIIVDGYTINAQEEVLYMQINPNDKKGFDLFNKINQKLSEIEVQLRFHGIEKNKREQEQARIDNELYLVRQLQNEQEKLAYEQRQLELEKTNFIEAKKQALINKAKEKGYSVQERVENGVVKLKLVKRIY